MGKYYVAGIPFDSENCLKHYGVKNMEWGKHKFGIDADDRYIKWLKNAGQSIGKFATNTAQNAARAATTAAKTAGTAVSKGANFVTGNADRARANQYRNIAGSTSNPAVQNYFNNRAKNYQAKADNSAFGRIGSTAQNVGNAVGGAAQNVGNWVGNRASDVSAFMTGDRDRATAEMLRRTADAQENPNSPVKAGGERYKPENLRKEADEYQRRADNAVLPTLSRTAKDIGGGVSNAANAVGSFVDKNITGNSARNEAAYLQSVVDGYDRGETKPNGYEYVGGRDQAAADKALAEQMANNSLFGRVGNAANSVGNWAGQTARNVGNAVGGAANAAGDWANTAVTNVGNTVGGAAQNVGNFLSNQDEKDAMQRAQDAADMQYMLSVARSGYTLPTPDGGSDQYVGRLRDSLAIDAANREAEKARQAYESNPMTKLQNAANDVGSAVGGAANMAGQAIGNAAQNVASGAKGAINSAGKWVQNAAGDVGRTAQNVASGAKGAINSAGKWVQNAAGNVGNTAKNIVGNPKGFINNAGQWVQNIAGNVGNAVSGAAKNVGDWAGQTAQNVGNAVGGAFNDAKNWAGQTAQNIGNTVGGAAQNVGNFIDQNITGNSARADAQNYQNQADVLPNTPATSDAKIYLDNAANNAQAKADNSLFGKVGNAFGGAANAAGNWIGGRAKDVGNAFNSAGQAIGGAAQNVGNAVGGAFNDAKNWAGQTAQNVGNWAGQTAQNVGNAVSGAAQNVGDWAGQTAQNVGNAVGGAAQNVGNWAGQAAQNVGNWAGQTAQNVGNAVGGAAQNVGNWAGQTAQNVGNAVGGAAQNVGNFIDYRVTGDAFNFDKHLPEYQEAFKNVSPFNSSELSIDPNLTGFSKDSRMVYSPEEALQYVKEASDEGYNRSLFGRVGNAANAVGNWAGQTAQNVGNAVGGAAQNVGNWAGQTARNVGNAVGGAANQAGQWIGNTAGNVGNAVGGAVNSAGQWIGGIPRTLIRGNVIPENVISENVIPENVIQEQLIRERMYHSALSNEKPYGVSDAFWAKFIADGGTREEYERDWR